MSEEYGIPILSSEGLAVIEAAIAFIDQLDAFNDIQHPEVKSRLLTLSETVDDYHNQAVYGMNRRQNNE